MGKVEISYTFENTPDEAGTSPSLTAIWKPMATMLNSFAGVNCRLVQALAISYTIPPMNSDLTKLTSQLNIDNENVN